MTKEEQAAEDRRRFQAAIDARHAKEAAARPNLLHRAVVFLLRETAANNRDTKREADYYIESLDKELADADALQAAEASAAEAANVPPNNAGEANQFDTARTVGQSSRFRKPGSRAAKAVAKPEETPSADTVPVKRSGRFSR